MVPTTSFPTTIITSLHLSILLRLLGVDDVVWRQWIKRSDIFGSSKGGHDGDHNSGLQKMVAKANSTVEFKVSWNILVCYVIMPHCSELHEYS
jgi:hypothetical protein